MIDRETIRTCIVDVIDSYKRDRDFEIYEHRDAILDHFDRSGIAELGEFQRFVGELEEQFPNSTWAMFATTFELYVADEVAKFPRQELPQVALTLSICNEAIDAGNTRIGGEPEWIQPPGPIEECPPCNDCNQIMAFVCQIDSIGVANQNTKLDDYRFVDSGCFYLFGCVKCGSTMSTFQSH